MSSQARAAANSTSGSTAARAVIAVTARSTSRESSAPSASVQPALGGARVPLEAGDGSGSAAAGGSGAGPAGGAGAAAADAQSAATMTAIAAARTWVSRGGMRRAWPDHVLPFGADYRQWTLSFPRWLRIRLLRDKALVSEVILGFMRVVSAYHRCRGQGRGVGCGETGAVTAIQLGGSFVNANVHFHTPIPESVWHE